MARMAKVNRIFNVQSVDGIAKIITCSLEVLFVDPLINGGSQMDNFTQVALDLNATPANQEVAIREAVKARGMEITGDAWANNDIYQSNIRRG